MKGRDLLCLCFVTLPFYRCVLHILFDEYVVRFFFSLYFFSVLTIVACFHKVHDIDNGIYNRCTRHARPSNYCKNIQVQFGYTISLPLCLCDCGLKTYKKSKAPVVDLDAQDLKISSFTAIVFDVRFKLQNLLITTDKIYLIRFYLIRFLIVCECRPINIVLRRTKFYQNLKYKTCTLTFALCLLPVACCFC